eukprot:TRINITY_DN23642_c0_g1_i1.p1 TRINITY_DN23642_c0_g1~~TRINITY_DN23642_c0_g1_i1.p1  ORF type:complete len:295 (+),score=42.63 TRINITY_DN23642_c0_g1_i1:28-912(+)
MDDTEVANFLDQAYLNKHMQNMLVGVGRQSPTKEALKGECAELRTKVRELERERDALHVQLDSLQTKHEASELRHAQEIAHLTAQLRAKDKEIDALRVEIQELKTEKTQLRRDVEELKDDVQLLKQEARDKKSRAGRAAVVSTRLAFQKEMSHQDDDANLKLSAITSRLETGVLHSALDVLNLQPERLTELKKKLRFKSQLADMPDKLDWFQEDYIGTIRAAYSRKLRNAIPDRKARDGFFAIKEARNTGTHPVELPQEDELPLLVKNCSVDIPLRIVQELHQKAGGVQLWFEE